MKTFSARVLLSTATGVNLPHVTTEDVQELIEYLIGERADRYSVDTALGQSKQWARARSILIQQIPALADVNGDNLRMLCKLAETHAERVDIANAWIAAESTKLGASEFAIRGWGSTAATYIDCYHCTNGGAS